MNYSKIITNGPCMLVEHTEPNPIQLEINQQSGVNIKFELADPDISDSYNSFFGVFTEFYILDKGRVPIFTFKTEQIFKMRDFYLSHNTEILTECCEKAYFDTISLLEVNAKNQIIKDKLFDYDKHDLQLKLNTYLLSYYKNIRPKIYLK